MNLQELRIGNWIYISNEEGMKFPHLVNLEYFKSDYHGNESPIPLTPDILEKAGFYKWNDKSFSKECSEFNIISDGEKFWLSHRDDYTDEEYKSTIFSCLHQLQNLYFALTGKELEIKL